MNKHQAAIEKYKAHLTDAERAVGMAHATSSFASVLSKDLEKRLFLLWRMGHTLGECSEIAEIHPGLVILTAATNDWKARSEVLGDTTSVQLAEKMMKSVANMHMIVTYLAYQAEVGEILSGKEKAQESRIVPRSMKGLQDLMTMVAKVNNMNTFDDNKEGSTPSQTVNIEQMQVLNAAPGAPLLPSSDMKIALMREIRKIEGDK